MLVQACRFDSKLNHTWEGRVVDGVQTYGLVDPSCYPAPYTHFCQPRGHKTVAMLAEVLCAREKKVAYNVRLAPSFRLAKRLNSFGYADAQRHLRALQ